MKLTNAARLTPGETALLQALSDAGECGAEAADLLRANGLPNRRIEEWRWSDLRAAIAPETAIMQTHDHLHDRAAHSVATEPQSIIQVLARALSNQDNEPFDADGLHEREGQACRSLNVRGAHKILIERIDSPDGLSAGNLTALVRDGSLTRVLIQDGTSDAIILNRADIVVGPGGRYEQFILCFGGKLVRLETALSLWDGGEAVLNAAYLVGPGRHCDLTSIITAEGPGTARAHVQGSVCNQTVKGVARKGGRGIFQGKILVQKQAQKTDARQYHQALLLEDGAEIFAKPELQIYADDVQCAHGNTIGALSADALFYMRTRGIPELEARAMLIEAFLADAILPSLPKPLGDEILSRLRSWLGKTQV